MNKFVHPSDDLSVVFAETADSMVLIEVVPTPQTLFLFVSALLPLPQHFHRYCSILHHFVLG